MVNRSGVGEKPGRLLGGVAVAVLLSSAVASASVLDDIGVTSLRSLNPAIIGTGVSVAQIEATTYTGPSGQAYIPQDDDNNFEVNPATVAPGPSPTPPGFAFVPEPAPAVDGTAPTTTYDPNLYSGHANDVATNFFGTTAGASPGVAAVVMYNANYFYSSVIGENSTIGSGIAANQAAIQTPLSPVNAPAVSVVNQSFIFDGLTTDDANSINQLYDDYVATHGTIFVSGVGNGGGPQVPATAYNVIAVGAYGGSSSVGPTSDGRCKPDIVAPASATSYSTPYVSGIVTDLVQAGAAGYGGTGTQTAAVDERTIEALLLNGATKPSGWTNSPTQPLDYTYGAGIVNAYNSYENLIAGKKNATAVNYSQTPVTGASVGTAGWNFSTLTSGSSAGVAHYYINLAAANGPSTLTTTLDWWRPAGTVSTDSSGNITSLSLTSINNLFLELYNVATGQLVNSISESISTIDNVQQIYLTNLPAGQYDLEVVKAAYGVTPTETYAMAFNLTGGAINLVVGAGGLDMHGASQCVGGITGTGTLTNSVATINTTLTVVGTSEFDGVIQNGAAQMSLVKNAGGVLTLTGNNTYTGNTTINAGTILASNSTDSATGYSNQVILNGGTLGGYGTIAGAVVAGSAAHTIAPSATLSATSYGTLHLASLSTNADTTLAFNLVTTGTSHTSDMISVTNAAGLTLNGGTIQVANTGTGLASLGYYKIIQYSGSFSGLTAGLTLPTTSNNIAYVLDTTHDPGYIDLHRGLLGDANDDGVVDYADFAILSNNFGDTGVGWSGGDFNGDGVVNGADFNLLVADYNGSISSDLMTDMLSSLADAPGAGAVSGVPEPASLSILSVGIVALLRRRRRADA